MPDVKQWTVLAYIVADDDGDAALLDRAAADEAQALCDALQGKNAHVAIQIDFKQRPGIFRRMNDQIDQWPGETAAGDSRVFNEFVATVKKQCPGHHYLLLLWGHGGGPIGFFNDGNLSASAASPTLSLNAVRVGLELLDAKVDILLAKSCSMATLEAAVELQGAVNYLIASQGNVSEHPWEYQHIVAAMKRIEGDDAEPVARAIVDGLRQHYLRTAEKTDDETPYSALSLARVGTVYATFGALVRQLNQTRSLDPQGWLAVKAAIEDARTTRPTFDSSLIDIVAVCQHLARLPQFSAAARAVAAAIQSTDLQPGLVSHYEPSGTLFRGVSIFHYPRAEDRLGSFANKVGPGAYGMLDLCKVEGWPEIAFDNAPWATITT